MKCSRTERQRQGLTESMTRRNVKDDSRDPVWNPKRCDRLDPGEVKSVTLIGAMVTAALLKLRAPPNCQPAPFRPALPAAQVQVVDARSSEPATLPKTRSHSRTMPAPLPQPTRRWLCPQEVGAETAPPTPARRIRYAGLLRLGRDARRCGGASRGRTPYLYAERGAWFTDVTVSDP